MSSSEPIVVRLVSTVAAPPEVAFEVATDVETWPHTNPTCRAVEVLAREGLATTFRFMAPDGGEWRSTQYACRAGLFSYTERHDPPPPLTSLAFTRHFEALAGGGARVFDEVNCALLPGRADALGVVATHVVGHWGAVDQAFRARVEARARENGGER